ncbi:MAG: Fic family protein [Prevotella sp.]|nr:Fic family protein [Candidatus Equicola stercoris]
MKISIRFYNDHEVRAVWEEATSKWYYSVLDVIGAFNMQDDYGKNRNYWKYLKAKLKKESSQVVSATTQLKLVAPDGKRHLTDVMDMDTVRLLAMSFPNNRSMAFIDWLTRSDNSIDGQSRKKAYALFESGILDSIPAGTIVGLQQIHGYLFEGLYDFAGKIRERTIWKDGTLFCRVEYLKCNLEEVEKMPQNTFDEIVSKYVEMNVCHPFMEGNGRSARIWLDLMFKKSLKRCVDWSKIDKTDYLNAMRKSMTDSSDIRRLLASALTDDITSRELFMKGIDYSYYYEQEDNA